MLYNRLFNGIKTYNALSNQELKDKDEIILFLTIFKDILGEENKLGHLTSSALVVNEELDKALVVYHDFLNGFVLPSTHMDRRDKYLINTVMNYVNSKSSIITLPLLNSEIFSIQIKPELGHYVNGEYISSHMHYEIGYLLQAREDILKSETCKWISLIDLSHSDMVLDSERGFTKKMIEKARNLK